MSAAAVIRPATPAAIAEAAERLRAGAVVAFPTETVYGLGADATNAEAVARVFEIKNRPDFDPLIVHIAETAMLDGVVQSWPAIAAQLAERFWPGPLTLVLPKGERIADIVTAGLASVAVRMPAHPVARALVARADRPIAAPSANPFGYVSPTTAAHVAAQLGDALTHVLDGGPCVIGVESTIVSLLEPQPTLLRPGGLAVEDIEALIGPLRLGGDRPLPFAPGQLPRHYAPTTPFRLVDTPDEVAMPDRPGSALLAWSSVRDTAGFAHVEVLAADGRLTTAAANLFAAMRRLDAGGFDRIYAVRVPTVGLGRAVMDRLQRAAAR